MSLAITEKRQPQQQRPGGCVGIFFQLLDWNRRLGKKKLFSKRLLPPVRAAKRVSKKVGGGGDDKMPMAKLLLIADENRGGFPNAKESDDLGDGMRAPGLVARLMGLESMPAVTRERPRKSLDSESERHGEKGDSDFPRLDQDLCPENGGLGKLESRPQKLQKTGGFLERQPTNAARAGSDVLLFSKNVLLSRSRKQHRKLASPVKSPRVLSGSHKARLVQAATRILEPGLQSRNRDKCALTYMSSSQSNAEEGSAAFASLKRSQELLSGSLVGSCRSCGSLVEVSELRSRANEPIENEYGSSALELSNASSSHDSCLEGKTKLSFMESKQSQTSLSVQAKVNAQSKLHDFAGRKKHVQNDQDPCKPQQDLAPRTIPKKKILRQNQPAPVRDKVAPGFKEGGRRQGRRDLHDSNEPKDFVALNRNMNNCSRLRSTSKEPERQRMETGRNGWERNIPRKRTINSSHFENVGAVNSAFEKPRIVGSHLINRKGTMPSSNRSINRNCVKSELQKKDGGHSFSGRNNDIVSFMFNSPMKHAARPCSYREVVEKSRAQGEISHESSPPKNFVLNPKNGNSMPQRRTALRGDELSNLLEQKIRELTFLDQDELGKRDARSTASILEDLISALTGGAPITEENDGNCFGGSSTIDDIRSHCIDLRDFPISQSQMCNDHKDFQEDAKASISASYLASNNDQPSPISILEASFSNDSCSFGSHNGSSGGKLHFELTEGFNTAVSFDLDNDLLDSATSIDIARSDIGKIPHSSDRSSAKVSEVKLPESKLNNAGETILNAGLLFENICLYNSDGTVESSVKSFLLGLLETLVHACVIGPKSCSDYTDAGERNWLRVFIFDCIIECLDLKYSQFCKSGYKTWKLPLFLSRDRLTREVQEEIKGWMGLAGRFLDDMIEKEMSHSTGRWTDCEIEAFETGTEVETDILQALVDEMVIDLC
ncbi:hypothetical protein COCNU_03G008830 [Cocos nucifera]|uniref:DUF4378 domain-containing protein n=1 Tax=Cocos nucifera TaxID=13894 RepID=A0A8K0I3G9_COCNU|nr:hypothetical protein COCNU_03G008830 [Cocos nucifera]